VTQWGKQNVEKQEFLVPRPTWTQAQERIALWSSGQDLEYGTIKKRTENGKTGFL